MANPLNTKKRTGQIPSNYVYSMNNNDFVRHNQLFGKNESKFSKLELPSEVNNTVATKIFKNNVNISQKLLNIKTSRTNTLSLPQVEPDIASYTVQTKYSLERALLSPTSLGNLRVGHHRHGSNPLSAQTSPRNTFTSEFSTRVSSLHDKKLKKDTRNTIQFSPRLLKERDVIERPNFKDLEQIEREMQATKMFENDRLVAQSPLNVKRDISYLSENKKDQPTLPNRISAKKHRNLSSFFAQNKAFAPAKTIGGSAANSILSEQFQNTEHQQLFTYESARIRGSIESLLTFRQKTNEGTEDSIRDLPFVVNNVLHTPIVTSPSNFSRSFYTGNQMDEINNVVSIPNLKAILYKDSFKDSCSLLETEKGKNSPLYKGMDSPLQSLGHIPKISDEKQGQLNANLKAKKMHSLLCVGWEEILDDAEVQELKKELPNVFSEAPPNRHDIAIISKWIQTKLTGIVECKNLNEEEKCKKCDGIYNIALNEIIRQISVDCVERGELLFKIWMSYLRMFSHFRVQLIEEQESIHDNFEDSFNRIHKMYKDIISEKDNKRLNLESELDIVTSKFSQLQYNYDKLLTKESEFLQVNDDLRKSIERLKLQIKLLHKENDNLQYRISNRQASPTKFSTGGSPFKVTLSNSNQQAAISSGRQQEEKLSIKNSFSSLNRTSFKDPVLPVIKTKANGDDESEAVTEESSDNFEFDGEGDEHDGIVPRKSKQIYRLDQLNTAYIGNINSDGAKETMEQETETRDPDFYALIYHEISCQTELILTEKKYDNVFSEQKYVDELVTEHHLKAEVDVVAISEEFKFVEKVLKQQEGDGLNNVPKRSSKRLLSLRVNTNSLTNKQSIDSMEGQPNSAHSLSRKRRDFKSPGSSADNSPELRRRGSTGIVKESLSKFAALNVDSKFNDRESTINALRDQTKNTIEANSQESDQSSLQSNLQESHKYNEPLFENPKKASEVLDKLPSSSQQSFMLENQGKKQSDDVILEEENGLTQINSLPDTGRGTVESLKLILNFEEYAENETELCRDSDLEDNDNETESNDEEEEQERRNSKSQSASQTDGISIIEERNDENSSSQSETSSNPRTLTSNIANKQKGQKVSIGNFEKSMRSYQKRNLEQNLQHSNIGSSPRIQPQLKSCSAKKTMEKLTLLQDINKLNQLAQCDGENSLVTKAQYFRIIRMYKVENEKAKLLQQAVIDLKMEQEKQRALYIAAVEENNKQILNIAQLTAELEKNRSKCTHGGCPICREEDEDQKAELELSEVIDEAMDDEGNESENQSEDADPASPSRRKKTAIRRDNKKTTSTSMAVVLGRRQAVDRKNNPANVIIAKLKQKKMSKFKNFMPLKMVLRQINQIYDDRIKLSKESTVIKEEELNCFIYNLYLNNFGFKKIAEQKFIILILSVKKYLHIVRINLFARFLGLLEGPANYNVDEFNKYVECVEFLSSNTLGTQIFNGDTDTKHCTPYIRFMEYLKHFSENKMGIEEYVEFKKEFDSMKENDPKNVNRYGIIDIDLLMIKILTKYRLICNRTKHFVINAFKAADLDGNRMCNLQEFILLYKYIESEKFDKDFVEQLFEDYADLNIEDERNLSFDKFTVICVEYGLFSDYQQDKFLMISKKEHLLEKLTKLASSWVDIFTETDDKLNSLKKADAEEVNKWREILNVLGQGILAPPPENPVEIKPLLIAYHIMKAEVNNLVENETVKLPIY